MLPKSLFFQRQDDSIMQHGDIWRGVDRLAQKHGMSPSRLAKLAGLDATAFNKSKRVSKAGRLRWPSTESLARALAAVDEEFSDFARLVDERNEKLVAEFELSQASIAGQFDSAGRPTGSGWKSVEIVYPDMAADTFALDVSDDHMAPVYQTGDRLVVSPTARIQPLDRVIAMHENGNAAIYEIGQLSATTVTLTTIYPTRAIQEFAKTDLAWIARILWVSR